MVSMEIVWRQCGEIFLWRFYGKISLKIVWGFHGEHMVNLITRMVSMEIVWRQCGEWEILWENYSGDCPGFSWRTPGRSNYQNG